MKCFLLFIVGLSLVCKTTCLVTTRPKTLEVTTDILENDTDNIEIKEKKKNSTEKLNKDIYLEDVVFSLQSQDWSEQEEACLNQTLMLIRNLRNFTLWAVWDWDSIASEPQGLLFGNRYQLGNFDECLNPPWVPSRPELKNQYCLADIVLERTDNAVKKRYIMGVDPDQSVLDYLEDKAHSPHSRPLNELTWGVCVPASCGPGSVERLMRTMLARSHLGIAGIRPRITTGDCQKQGEERPYDAAFWAFIAVSAVLIITSLVCTYLNSGRFKCEPTTLKDDIIEAFCLRKNANNLLKMQKDTGIEVFYGIRFLGLCGIVIVHQLGILNAGAVSNGIQVDQLLPGPVGWIILHDDLFVDTFFLLSGFLTATAFSQMKRFPNPLFAILKRYIRLVPAFAVVVFFVSAVYPYTGSGPMWPKLVEGETGSCRKNWWLSLLMLNNYIDSEHICLVVSWYIPCDFHFSCVAILLYWLYTRQPKLGLVCAGAITVASILLPGVLTYNYNWNPIQLFTFEFVSNPRGSLDFHHMYIKSHHRAAAYIVGFFSGFLFIKNKRENAMTISRKWAILGSISGIVIMLAVLISGTTFLWRDYHPIEGAVYAAINRPLWTVGVAMLVLCCSLGYVPLIKAGLSWYVWVPLSRLSYGVYLTHTLICMRSVFVARNSQHYGFSYLFNTVAGVIFWGCVAAFFIWLIVEAPAIRLFDIFVKRVLMKHTRELKAEEKSATQQTSTNSTPGSSSGHLQDNLPTNVQFSSKV